MEAIEDGAKDGLLDGLFRLIGFDAGISDFLCFS
jgi:hypothetical protein